MSNVEGYSQMIGKGVLLALIAFRLLNALVVRTSFTPDEFWQGPEPAHLLAFGKGHLTWEWEPSARIRGFTHPLVFAGVYKALHLMGWDTRWAVAHSPKLLQGLMAGVCDYCTFGLALQAFGAAAARWALLFQVLSWFNFYCLVRPYSNSAEAVLATAALFCWAPFLLKTPSYGGGKALGSSPTDSAGSFVGGGTSREICALFLAALCVAIRPTSAALWTVVGLARLAMLPPRRWPFYILCTVLPPVTAVVGASFCLDSVMYGAMTLVPLNFLRFNVLEGQSRIFGEQAWHWNFSQGLPAVLGAALPAALLGFCRPAPGDRRLGWLAAWFLVYHSTSPHKEFRFLLPVLPIAHAYAGQAVASWVGADDGNTENASLTTTKPQGDGTGTSSGNTRADSASSSQTRRRRQARAVIVAGLLFVLHVPAAVYLSVWHQSGALSAVDSVANRIAALSAAGGASAGESRGRVTVHFLMPCHAAPLHSHLHFRDIETDLYFLDCSPKNRELSGGSESDRFQADPLGFLKSIYGNGAEGTGRGTSPAPDLAVMYSTHLEKPGVDLVLKELGLVVVEVLFNTHINGDADCDDTHRSVMVLERTDLAVDVDVDVDVDVAVCQAVEKGSCIPDIPKDNDLQ